jgi:hypothetical protein
MSSDWSRKRGREGEQKPADESKAGGSEVERPPAGSHVQPPAARYPPGARAPEGYYPPAYPPSGDGSAAYPPPRGYEGAAYGMPPHMQGYPMYPYQPPMYAPYPGYPAPPHMNPYGYPPDPAAMGGHPPQPRYEDQGANAGPYPPGPSHAAPAPAASRGKSDPEDEKKPSSDKGSSELAEDDEDGDDDDEEDPGAGEIVPGAVTARLKTYIKPRIPSTQDVLDRRSRKNAQSRARASKLRERISVIELKPDPERNEEEKGIWAQYENRRQRKNDRSRERALEKKEEIDRILGKPEKRRSKIEKQFLDTALVAKKRKNEGDRQRRQRLKELGLAVKGQGFPPYGTAGHMMFHHHPPGAYPRGYGHMGEIPMSPMPAMGHPHHHMQSPGTFGSPGMMHTMGYPSPQHARRPAAAPGVMDTPGRTRAEQVGGTLPYIPPPQAYDAQTSPAARSQPNHQHRVEQRRNPDGSMSISIGAGSEEQSAMNISDVSHLLLYSDNGEGGEAEGGERQESQAEAKAEE